MVFIPKNDGGVRGLGVANLFRRIIGRAIARAALGKRSATLSWLIERGSLAQEPLQAQNRSRRWCSARLTTVGPS